jgi:hypothetical protein
MKIISIVSFLLFSFTSYSKCSSISAKEAIKDYPIIVEATPYDANFTSARALTKKQFKSEDFYPTYKLKVHNVLKGEAIPEILSVRNYRLRFGTIMYPNPFYRFRENVKRVFFVNKISNKGFASVSTSQCTPFLNYAQITKLL